MKKKHQTRRFRKEHDVSRETISPSASTPNVSRETSMPAQHEDRLMSSLESQKKGEEIRKEIRLKKDILKVAFLLIAILGSFYALSTLDASYHFLQPITNFIFSTLNLQIS